MTIPRPVRVLLVEDNPADVDLARETLEASKVLLDLSVATDGVEALDFVGRCGEHGVPDLILLDLNLPRLDGRGVLAHLKEDERLRRIPVIVLTSSEAERDVVQSYDLGANCYVTKPMDFRAFQTVVRGIEGFWFTIVRLPFVPSEGAAQ